MVREKGEEGVQCLHVTRLLFAYYIEIKIYCEIAYHHSRGTPNCNLAHRVRCNFSSCVNVELFVSRVFFIKLLLRPRHQGYSSRAPPSTDLNCLIGVKLGFLLVDSFAHARTRAHFSSSKYKERAIRIICFTDDKAHGHEKTAGRGRRARARVRVRAMTH